MILLVMKTYFYLSRKFCNKQGLCPIYCRIAHGSDRADFSTGIYISDKDWNTKIGMPIKKLVRENQLLDTLRVELIRFIFQCENQGITSAIDVLQKYKELKKPTRNTLIDCIDLFMKETKLSSESIVKFTNLKKNCEKMIGNINVKNIEVAQLNFLREKMIAAGYTTGTINKKMTMLKRVFVFIEQKDFIKKNPFGFYTPIRGDGKKPISLDQDELKALEQIEIKGRLDNARNLFLMQCYTGLSYVDLCQYSTDNIQTIGGKKIYAASRKKTGTDFYFPVDKKILELGKKMKIISNQKYNIYLKDLARIIGTKKNIASHMARKTFAQLHINKGISFETVAVMLGHSSTSITERHYSRAGIDRLIFELGK